MYVELRELIVCRNDMEAHIIKGVLEENDIEVYIRKDDCGGMEPQLQITEGIRILVPSQQFVLAESILAQFKKSELSSNELNQADWTCSNCGEILEGQFSDCWNCGTSREST